MNRKQREATKAHYEALRQSRSAAQARSVEERSTREEEIRKALARPVARVHGWATREVERVIAAKAPRLLDPRYGPAVSRLLRVPALRNVEDWAPRGKGGATLFRSLAAHLLATVPVPAIVWNAFHDDNAEHLVALAAHVARGGSLYEHVRSFFPVPLTRRMCHELLATPADFDLTTAIRRVQARAAGADLRFFEAWRRTRHALHIHAREHEAFWWSVVEWFGRAPMLDPGAVGPLLDYVAHRHQQDAGFSMKGRSATALLRAMTEWHGDLSRAVAAAGRLFPASGFAGAAYPDVRREPDGAVVKETWSIGEVLTARDLADEGKRMGHCVYSYASRIEKGETSIWSVKMEDGRGETGRWHMVTVEVSNALRRVVQARGRFNRAMTTKETQVVRRWAGANGLVMSVGRW